MLKILQTRLQQYVNREFQMFELGLEKAEEPDNCQYQLDHRKSKGIPVQHLFVSMTALKSLTVWITIKGFGIVNKAEIDVFLELSYFFDDPADVGNLVSGSSAFSKTSLNIWKFTVHVLLKPGLENFEHYFTSV